MTELTPYIVAAIFSVISYLLKDKIDSNKEAIKDLKDEIAEIKQQRELRNESVNQKLSDLKDNLNDKLNSILKSIGNIKS